MELKPSEVLLLDAKQERINRTFMELKLASLREWFGVADVLIEPLWN